MGDGGVAVARAFQSLRGPTQCWCQCLGQLCPSLDINLSPPPNTSKSMNRLGTIRCGPPRHGAASFMCPPGLNPHYLAYRQSSDPGGDPRPAEISSMPAT